MQKRLSHGHWSESVLHRAYQEAKQCLTAHRDQLERVTAELLARETLDGVEFYQMVGRPKPCAKEPVPPLPAPKTVATAQRVGS